MINGSRVIDTHMHFDLDLEPQTLVDIMDETGTDMACLQTVPHRHRLSSVPDALMMKDRFPGRFYVFGSLDWSIYYSQPKHTGSAMKRYCSRMLKAGCDGIKIIEGKPNMRKELPVPDWDKPEWEPFFAWLEKNQIPVLWHVNDPETFWNPDIAPQWARDKGWFYTEDYINNEEQYRQILTMLERHPKLKICFAHFFFMSGQLERLRNILNIYPNVRIDITPGAEMYENFSERPDEVAAFFEEFADRILYGTDIAGRCILGQKGKLTFEESRARVNLVRGYISGQGKSFVPADGFFLCQGREFSMNSPGFSTEMQKKIYAGNFLSFVSDKPKATSARLIIRECRRIRRTLKQLGAYDKKAIADTSCIDRVEAYYFHRSFSFSAVLPNGRHGSILGGKE